MPSVGFRRGASEIQLVLLNVALPSAHHRSLKCGSPAFFCVTGCNSPQKQSKRSEDTSNVFVRRRRSRHVLQDFLFPEKCWDVLLHLQLEQNRMLPFVSADLLRFVLAFSRTLQDRARSALLFKQLEHVFRFGSRFVSSKRRLQVEQKNIRAHEHQRQRSLQVSGCRVTHAQ